MQYAKNVMNLPMRRHFKSCFPALHVCWIDECGRKSLLTDIFGMKTELQIPGTLMYFICTWGAMKGLLHDNAKAQTSMA
eukprot:9888379-Ditylum_brightwellii.AAC.1